MRNGCSTVAPRSLLDLQQHARQSLQRLPTRYRQLQNPPAYPVRPSAALAALLERVRQAVLQPAAKKNPR